MNETMAAEVSAEAETQRATGAPRVDLASRPIIYFAPGDWWTSNPADWMRLAIEFSEHTPVLFVNTVSPSIPRKVLSRNFLRRALRKLPSYFKGLRKVRPNLYVFTPFTLFTSKPALVALNRAFLGFQIRMLQRLLRFRKPILWVSNAVAAPVVERLDYGTLVYSVTDKFDETRYIRNKDTLRKYDAMLTERADYVMCVSRPIERLYQERAAGRVSYLPHAVDYDHFARERIANLPIPPEIAEIPRPIIGYHGSLTDSNDLPLISYCAEKHPEWSFFLIGKVMHNDVEALGRKYSNVYLPGFVHYGQIPAYARHFDCCLLFWKMTEWIRHCNPYKTKEYLAMGRPVVSVPIPEIVEEYSDVISVGETAEEFCAAIERELSGNSREREDARVARVREETWSDYVERVRRILLGRETS